jgi:hypothetical protein
MKVMALWDIASCSLIEVDQSFRGAYCFHQYAPLKHNGAISQKAVIFILATVRTRNLTCTETAPYAGVNYPVSEKTLEFENVDVCTF